MLGGVVYYFYKHIQPIIVSEINKTLAVKVEVDNISISGIRDFPKLGVKFDNVRIDESSSHYNAHLLNAKELSLFVDIFKLYKNEYVVDAITLRSATLRVADLAKGSNYDITKASTEKDTTALSFEIKKLTLIDCYIQYAHIASELKTSAYAPNARIGLKYVGDVTQLSISSALDSLFVSYEKETWVANKNVKLNTYLELNTATEKVAISESDLVIEQVELKTNGSIDYSEKSELDIHFNNAKAPVKKLISILPASAIQSLDGINLDGSIKLVGRFVGKTYGKNNPSFDLDFETDNMDIALAENKLAINKITASGGLKMPNVNNTSTSTFSCAIKNVSTGSNSLMGKLDVSNLERPSIQWDGIVDLEAALISGLADIDGVDINTGRVKIDGQLALVYDIEKETLQPNSLKYTGKAEIQGVSGAVQNPNLAIKNLDADLSANNDKMVVNSAKLAYNNTTASLKGVVTNYKSMFDEEVKTTLLGELEIDGLVVNELYADVDSNASHTASTSEISPIKLDLKLNLTNFKYNDFEAQSLTGTLVSDRTKLQISRCNIEALEGNTIASIGLKKWGSNFLLDINSDIKKVNISELFREFNNFEQTEITHEHISGVLTGTILAKVILDENFEPIMPKLYAKANIVVENGALVNYEPLQELSSFVNIEDLKNVKFQTLKTEIEIFDQTIFIPRTMIKNNALNLEIEGTHTFENYMHYNMGLSVAELLATKAKWIAKKSEKRIENNQEGGLTAYIIMKGTPDDLQIKYDRATVKENIKEEAKKEKENFIKALKGEGSLEEDEADKKDYDNVWDE